MTLNDQGCAAIAGLLKCDFSYNCAAVDKISADSASHGCSAVGELLVVY